MVRPAGKNKAPKKLQVPEIWYYMAALSAAPPFISFPNLVALGQIQFRVQQQSVVIISACVVLVFVDSNGLSLVHCHCFIGKILNSYVKFSISPV